MTRKKTGPRSEMGRLNQALNALCEARVVAFRAHLVNPTAPEVNRLYEEITRQQKAIIERVRKLIRKGRVSSRVECSRAIR